MCVSLSVGMVSVQELYVFLGVLKDRFNGPGESNMKVDEFIGRFVDDRDPLRCFFNGMGAMCGPKIQTVWMNELHQMNRGIGGWRGPCSDNNAPARGWRETGSFVCIVRKVVVIQKTRDLLLLIEPKGARLSWVGGVCANQTLTMAHPNEMSNEMACSIEVDWESTGTDRYWIGGSCCVYNYASPRARLPSEGLLVTFPKVYRRYRDGKLCADDWTIWAASGKVFKMKAPLLCSDKDCPTYKARKGNAIEKFKHHHPRRIPGGMMQPVKGAKAKK